ncbi:MAG: helix-turn-helix transcriptional regulator [Chloroflexota bacterium]
MISDRQRMAFFLSLSPRCQQIVRYVTQNLDNAEIAACLFITPGVVANHLTAIYEKLQDAGYSPEGRRYKRAALVGFLGDFFRDYPDIADATDGLNQVIKPSVPPL